MAALQRRFDGEVLPGVEAVRADIRHEAVPICATPISSDFAGSPSTSGGAHFVGERAVSTARSTSEASGILEAENADLKRCLSEQRKQFAWLARDHRACEQALQIAQEREHALRAEMEPAASQNVDLKQHLTELQVKVQQQLPRINELQRKVPQ